MDKKLTENSKKTARLRPYRWKKGQSGNPGGRPKTKVLSEAYRNALAELSPKDQRTLAEAIAAALVRRALKSDVRAAAEIADRTEGKAPQSVRLEGDRGIAVYFGNLPIPKEFSDKSLPD